MKGFVGVRSVRTVWGTALALAVTAIAGSCGHDTIELAKTTDSQATPDGGDAVPVDAGHTPRVDAGPCGMDCEALGGVCLEETGKCAGCESDGDCKNPFLPACDLATRTCVSCLSTQHCDTLRRILPPPFNLFSMACNTQLSRCGIQCSPTEECPFGLECDPERGLCIECSSATGALQCGLSLGVFKQCFNGACVGCLFDADCPNEHCDQTIQQCVGCLDSSHCGPGRMCHFDTRSCVDAP